MLTGRIRIAHRSIRGDLPLQGCRIPESDSRESIAAWFQKMGLPYDSIVEVEYEGDRGVIQDLKEEAALAGAR